MATALAAGLAGAPALAQDAPHANGETLIIQSYPGIGNPHALVAIDQGFCEKYNFTCEVNTIASAALGVQALVAGSIGVATAPPDLLGAADSQGSDVAVIGTSMDMDTFALTVRSDEDFATAGQGYPDVLRNLKGKTIGVTARGTSSEYILTRMLADAGLTADDVTFVAVGGPSTAFASLTVGQQVDAAYIFQPMTQLCAFNEVCHPIVDNTSDTLSPEWLREWRGASNVFAARQETIDSNPELMRAFIAAMTDAATWFKDENNLEELARIYEPVISFGDDEASAQLRETWLRDLVHVFSSDLTVDISAMQLIAEFAYENQLIDAEVDATTLVWEGAPQRE